MTKFLRRCAAPLLLAFSLLTIASTARAQGFSVTITVDENGHMHFTNTAGFDQMFTGALAADPGPGGRASALTYDLQNPPGLVAGDLLLFESADLLSDVIRFNAPTSSSGSLVFYSDLDDGADAIADVGFPTSFYDNQISAREVGPEGGPNGITYTPTAGQPGFVAGAGGPVTYIIESDTVTPEPSTVVLMLTGLTGLGGMAIRRRHLA